MSLSYYDILIFLTSGNYDGASIYYEALIPSMQRFTTNMNDPMRKGKWTMVRQNHPMIMTIFNDVLNWIFNWFIRFNNKSIKNINSWKQYKKSLWKWQWICTMLRFVGRQQQAQKMNTKILQHGFVQILTFGYRRLPFMIPMYLHRQSIGA